MLLPQPLSKKVKDHYIIWLEKPNQWIQLEEPAYYVFHQHFQSRESESIIKRCARRYHLSLPESKRFVYDILHTLERLSIQQTPNSQAQFNAIDIPLIPNFSISHIYILNDKLVEIEYETALLAFFLHPFLSRYETSSSVSPAFRFQVFRHKLHYVLRVFSQPQLDLFFDDIYQLKRELFKKLASCMYGIPDAGWMSFVHASAVTNSKETILFSSYSGSGKSTLAALLQNAGLQVVSDDFLPLDAKTCRAYPFPAALSVKEGAYPLFRNTGTETDKDSPEKTRRKKPQPLPVEKTLMDYRYQNLHNNSMRLLPLDATKKSWYKPHPVKKIVFIQFNPSAKNSFHLEKLPVTSAFQLFHEHAWVSGDPTHAKKFLNWFLKLECYTLEYSNTPQALRAITQLFTH